MAGAGELRALHFRDAADFGEPRVERETLFPRLRERVGDFRAAGFRGAQLDFDVRDGRAAARDFAFVHQQRLPFLRDGAVELGEFGEQLFEFSAAAAVGFVRAFDVPDATLLVRSVALESRFEFGASCVERGAFLFDLRDAFPQVVLSDFRHADLRFGVFLFRSQGERRLRALFDFSEKFRAFDFRGRELFFAFPQRVARDGDGLAQRSRARFESGRGGVAFGVLMRERRQVEVTQPVLRAAEAQRLRRLPLQRAHAPRNFLDDVGDAGEVLVDEREFPERLLALRLVARDAGGFLEKRAAFRGIGGENLVDLPLHHERVGNAADARVHEQSLNVLEAAGFAVEKIVRGVFPRNAAHDGNLVERGAEFFFAVREDEFDFAEAERLALVRSRENDVVHRAAAQRLRALLSEHPANRVDDVRFSAAVRPDNRRDARRKSDARAVREAFEPVDDDFLQIHFGEKLAESYLRGGKGANMNCAFPRGAALRGEISFAAGTQFVFDGSRCSAFFRKESSRGR